MCRIMLRSTLLDDLSPVIGFSATCALAAWWGGRTLYVPARYSPGHPLARVIGPSALRRLVEEFGSEPLSIPLDAGVSQYQRERRACEMYAAGSSPDDVAKALNLTVRRAQQLRTELAERGWLEFVAAGQPPVRRVGPVLPG